MNIKIAVLQKKSLDRQVEESTKIAISYMKEAKAQGADILLFPECFLTGYKLPISNEEALADTDESILHISRAAARLQLGVVITGLTKGEKRPQNSAFVIDKSGNILMKYAKVHTCDFADEACLEPGREFKVCDFEGVKLGIMICYDREYPESARVLMMKGAELILVPNDCGAMKPRLQALSTRAYENMVGVVMANPNGPNAGNSCAFSPICWDEKGRCVDNVMMLAPELEEGIFYAEYDMEQLRAYRSSEMMGNTFRKTYAYEELMNPQITLPFIRKGQ